MDEVIELPSVCDKCLGPDSNIKILKHDNGAACKLCSRPFTVFMWKPMRTSKHLKTIVCSTCSKTKNCCQSCMLDINYGIPLDVRDAALKLAGIDTRALSEVSTSQNAEIRAQVADKKESKFLKDKASNEDGSERAREILTKLAEKFGKSVNTSKQQKKSEKNLSASVNKVDISKYVKKLPFGGTIDQFPEDKLIQSFFIFGIDSNVPQYSITDYCGKYGPLSNITIIHKAGCGFINFKTRQIAEEFAQSIVNNGLNSNKKTAGLLILEGKYPVRVSWSGLKELPVNSEEQVKLNSVVLKAMKQLADQDKEANKKRKPTEQRSQNTKKAKRLPSKADNEYSALSEDFEL